MMYYCPIVYQPVRVERIWYIWRSRRLPHLELQLRLSQSLQTDATKSKERFVEAGGYGFRRPCPRYRPYAETRNRLPLRYKTIHPRKCHACPNRYKGSHLQSQQDAPQLVYTEKWRVSGSYSFSMRSCLGCLVVVEVAMVHLNCSLSDGNHR
jgi:hypothetical protein